MTRRSTTPWLDAEDPRSSVALITAAIMLIFFGAVVAIAWQVITEGGLHFALWLGSISATVSGVVGALYRLQYLYESRAMVKFFDSRIGDVEKEIRGQHA